MPLLAVFILVLSSHTGIKPADGWQPVKADVAANELITINKRILKNERYSFTINYSSYKEYNDTKPYDNQNGNVVKDGDNLYSKILGALTIQNKKLRVVADSSKHFVKITDPLTGTDPNFNVNDYIKVIGICKSVKRKEVDGLVAYRFEPKATIGIIAQEIYLGQDCLMKSVIYYSNENETRHGDKTEMEILHPKLEITISDYKKLEKTDKEQFSTDNILAINKNEISLKGKYRSFKFFDGRIKK